AAVRFSGAARVLARQPDVATTLCGVARDVDDSDARRPFVRVEERREDADGGGLPGAVGPEQAEDAGRLDAQVDAAKGLYVAVALAQPVGLAGSRHVSTPAADSLAAGD